MNETTDKLIRDLAEKLGTTAEHLWNVLIRQAPIAAITDLLQCLILAAVCVYGGRRLMRWHQKLKENDDTDHPGFIMLYILFIVLLFVTIIYALCSVPEIVTALANPEFWALKQIVK